ncbi:hypothetical protein HYW54_02545 [Candidatus Gottesmanbacteria bacterium]|nr:hypothetical protein [Candidatus Gottesmanbacteria bacterium]
MKIYFIFSLFILFFLSFLSLFPNNALAQEDCSKYSNDFVEEQKCRARNQAEAASTNKNSGICNPVIPALCGIGNVNLRFGSLVSSLFAFFIIIAALFTFINLLLGGFGWITSGGDKAAVDAARSRIQNALIGIFITAATWVLFIIAAQFLGITPLGSSVFQIRLPTLFGR